MKLVEKKARIKLYLTHAEFNKLMLKWLADVNF